MNVLEYLGMQEDDLFTVYKDWPLNLSATEVEAGQVEALKREYVMNKAYADGLNLDGSVRPVNEPDWAELENDSIEWFVLVGNEWCKVVESEIYDALDEWHFDNL